MLTKNYRIKIRDKDDYKKLIRNHIPSPSLDTKTSIFNNKTVATEEEGFIVIKSKLNISAVTIILSIILLYFSYLIITSFNALYEITTYVVILIVSIASIIKSEHTSIEAQILKKLY